jgi:hypothetical protein
MLATSILVPRSTAIVSGKMWMQTRSRANIRMWRHGGLQRVCQSLWQRQSTRHGSRRGGRLAWQLPLQAVTATATTRRCHGGAAIAAPCCHSGAIATDTAAPWHRHRDAIFASWRPDGAAMAAPLRSPGPLATAARRGGTAWVCYSWCGAQDSWFSSPIFFLRCPWVFASSAWSMLDVGAASAGVASIVAENANYGIGTSTSSLVSRRGECGC